eukprot:m.431551 g.431551  ORF g.431551 m.431551 type:complete len:481 (-) comp17317_c0_seq1:116-1558(-)
MGKKKKSGKKGSGKKKKAAEDVPDPTEGMTIEELRDKVIRMMTELDKEREERNYFQLERDKINSFWEITKRQHEESKATLRNKDREMEEADERHAVEIKVYKQKVKHLLYENQSQIHELKKDSAVDARIAADEHRAAQADLGGDKRALKVQLKQAELEHEDLIKELQIGYDKKVTSLRDDLQRTAQEMHRKYERKMEVLRDELELRRKVEIKEIEERKNAQIHTLMQNHEKAFGDIKNYYNDITLNNMALINSLKEQVEEMKTKGDRDEKLMAEIKAENKSLVEPLKKARGELEELEKQLESYTRDKKFLASTRARLTVAEETIKQHEWRHEVLDQRFAKVQAERDELYDKFVKTIYDVQQKSGFKNLVLEKKLGALEDQLEKKEAQLNEVLRASNLDPTAMALVTRKLEDVLDAKNAAIKDLQYELARACKAHNDVIRTYEAKLTKFGVPVEELGFEPMELNPGQQIGSAPAGLVSARS